MKLNGNILIADDEKNIREGLKIYLLKDKHKIFLSEDGINEINRLTFVLLYV